MWWYFSRPISEGAEFGIFFPFPFSSKHLQDTSGIHETLYSRSGFYCFHIFSYHCTSCGVFGHFWYCSVRSLAALHIGEAGPMS